MIVRHAQSWQLILADLALILFLVTLSALAVQEASSEAGSTQLGPEIAPAQALFRPDNGGPSLADWLSERPADARATLTVFAQHAPEERDLVWDQAEDLAEQAQQGGFAVRVVITQGQESDLYASLAYDAHLAAD